MFALTMDLMEWIHSFAFSSGRKIRNRRVSTNHPSIVFFSSGVPSPISFRILAASGRGSASEFVVGRKNYGRLVVPHLHFLVTILPHLALQ